MVKIREVVPSQEPASRVEEIVSSLLAQGVAEPSSAEEVADYVTHCASSPYEAFRALIAEEDGGPIGWLGVMPWPGGYATLHSMRWASLGWPSVVPRHDTEAVGLELLAAAERAVPEDVRSLIVSIARDAGVRAADLDRLKLCYAKAGYRFADLVHFIHATGDAEAPPSAPPGVTVAPLREIAGDRLEACILEVFGGKASAFFCGGSCEEQNRFLHGLRASPAMEEPSSIVLCASDEPIGFASTIGDREDGNLLIDWMGIRAGWRRKGFGTFLLGHVLAAAAAEGYASVSLSSDARNDPAIGLYRREGWTIEGGERQFSKQLRSASSASAGADGV
jgi:GNAT superfamily N-acetyltransferase